MMESMERVNFVFKGIGAVIIIGLVLLSGSFLG